MKSLRDFLFGTGKKPKDVLDRWETKVGAIASVVTSIAFVLEYQRTGAVLLAVLISFGFWASSKAKWIKVAVIIFCLIGLVVFFNLHSDVPRDNRTEWLPPKIADDCVHVLIQFASNRALYPVEALEDPLFDSRFGVIEESVFEPYIRDRRLYLKATLFNHESQLIRFDDRFDTKLPVGWDWNCSSNAYEIVDDAHLPRFQLIYERPHMLQVSGIFVQSNYVVHAFDGVTALPRSSAVESLEHFAQHPMTKNRKAIFKYPRWKHPGIYAD